MKKLFYLFFTVTICLFLLSGCSLFAKDKNTEDTTVTENEETTSTEELDDVPVTNPSDGTTTEDSGTGTATTEEETSHKENPRDNVAKDEEKEFKGTGKFYGFIDSNSVEIELDDGSYCTFFVFEENVREALTKLLDGEPASISFTYKALEGQINPEIIDVQ